MTEETKLRMSLFGALAILPTVAGLACSGGSGGAQGGGVTGAWCGLQVATAAACAPGDAGNSQPVYAEFTQSGAIVTGQSCEYYLSGCYALENGSLTGNTLTFQYTFSPYQVDATLTLSADMQTLAGAYTSTKCSCDLPVTLHRLP